MKKLVCLVLVLGLMLCAAGAWAEAVVIDFAKFGWRNDNYNTYTDPWYWDLKDKGGDNYRLYINESGEYTIRNMHDYGGLLAASIIIGDQADNVTLNLENVKLSGSNEMGRTALLKEAKGTLNVNLGKDTVLSGSRGIAVSDGNPASAGESFVLNVSGEGRIEGVTGISVNVSKSDACPVTVNVSGSVQITGSDAGVYAMSSGDVRVSVRGGAKIASEESFGIYVINRPAGRSVVTLGDNVTVQGQKGAVQMEKDKGELIIDGKTYPGIVAEKSMEYDGAGAKALSSSPYYDANKNVFAEAGTWTKEDAASNNNNEFVTNARFIRTLWSPESAVLPQTGSLPQTGDSSRLALWGAMLAIAGAGMMVARKREA